MVKWYCIQVDRDFNNGCYGDGIRLYYETNPNYVIITGVSYQDGILKVIDDANTIYELKDEPDNESFETTLFADWKSWDTKYGSYDQENRSDYEPWSYNSIKSLACGLGLHEEDVTIYYKKDC